MEVLQKIENRHTWSSHPTPLIFRGNDINMMKRNLHPVFIAAIFSMAEKRKQLKCLSADEWIENMI